MLTKRTYVNIHNDCNLMKIVSVKNFDLIKQALNFSFPILTQYSTCTRDEFNKILEKRYNYILTHHHGKVTQVFQNIVVEKINSLH